MPGSATGGGLLARQCLGLAYVALERWDAAATVYEQAARDADGGQRSPPRRFLGPGRQCLARRRRLDPRALQAFDAALATTSLSDELRGEVHLDRARALVALGNAAGARTDLDRALQLVPSDPFAWYLSAALARRENDLARARTDIARALQLAPDNPDIVLLAGTLAGLAGNMAEAERLYRRVADGAPDSDAGRAGARQPGDAARGRGAGGHGAGDAGTPVTASANPTSASAAAAAAASASVQVEFDRRHDADLLERRFAGAAASPRWHRRRAAPIEK